eukprot:scaffold16475_cov70-Phaeocystis_antarctica.AAC.1
MQSLQHRRHIWCRVVSAARRGGHCKEGGVGGHAARSMPLGHAVLGTDRDKLRKLRQWRYEGSDYVQSVLTPEEWQGV